MQKLLLVEDDLEMADIIREMILEEVEEVTEVLTVSKAGQAIDLLADDENIVGIVSDFYLKGDHGSIVYKYNHVKTKLPFTFLTAAFQEEVEDAADGFSKNKGHRFFVSKPFEQENLISIVQKMLASNLGKEVITYKRIRTTFLKRFLKESADIYLKMSPGKYVKIMKSENDLDLDFIERYESKEEEFLYMDEGAYLKLFGTSEVSIEENSKNIKNEHDVLTLAGDVIGFVNEALRNFGIQDSQINLINNTAALCVQNLKGDKELKSFIDEIFNQKDYLLGHSLLAMHLSSRIIKNSKLNSKNTIDKLVYSSLLHDSFLPSSKFSRIRTKDQSEFSELDPREKALVKDHSLFASKLVEKNDSLPIDIVSIIEQHHERPDGSGFPRGVRENRIKPLSAVFILSLEVAHHICIHGFQNHSIQDLRKKLIEEYDEGNFKPYLAELLSFLK